MAVMQPINWRRGRGRWFSDAIRAAEDSDRAALLTKVGECRDIYMAEGGGFDATEEQGPWLNAANLHIPLVTEKVETAVPKIMSAIWRAEPFVNVTRSGGSDFDVQKTKDIENFASWAFRNDIPGFYLTLENFLRNMLIDGTAFMKIRWERKERRAVETHTLNAYTEMDGIPVQRPIEDLLKEVFGLGDVEQTYYRVAQLDNSTFRVYFTEQGREYEARVELIASPNVNKVDMRVFRTIVERECPMVELVEIEDLVFPTRSKCLQTAKWVAHKTWYTYREIEKLVKSGAWNITKKDMGILKANETYSDDSNDHEDLKDKITGLGGNNGQHLNSADDQLNMNKLAVWEIYTEDYADDEDDPISVIHFMPELINCIAGTEYADEIFPHGKRPLVSATYIPIANRIYGMGMAETLYGINLSMDRTINTIQNNMEITTNPVGFYTPMSMAQNGNSMNMLKPGTMIATADPSGVHFPKFNQQPLEMFHASYNQMRTIADNISFSQSIGGSNSYTNAPRTARGTMALMDAAEEKLSTIVEQLQATAWKDMISQVVALYGKYVTIDKWYKVTGESKARYISPKELRENLIFSFSGSLTSVNRDVQRTLIQQMYLTLKDEPEYQQDPNAKNNLRRYYVTAFGENLDVESVLPDPPGQAGFAHPPWTQEQENRSMANGTFVHVLPVDDDMAHLKELEAFAKTELYAHLPGEIKGLFMAHGKTHETSMQQKMAQQQKMANTQGTGAAAQGMAEVATPGSPTEGQPAMSGELSVMGGVT